MGYGAVQRHHCPYPHTGNHEPHLVDEAVGKDSSQVIFNNRVKDGERCHDGPDPYEGLCSWKGPCQCIDRDLCGKSAQENGSGNGCLRIGIGEPWMKDRPRAIEAKPKENKIGPQAIQPQIPELYRAGLIHMNHNAC